MNPKDLMTFFDYIKNINVTYGDYMDNEHLKKYDGIYTTAFSQLLKDLPPAKPKKNFDYAEFREQVDYNWVTAHTVQELIDLLEEKEVNCARETKIHLLNELYYRYENNLIV